MIKKYATERKQTQRLVPLRGQHCAKCGTRGGKRNKLQRHHPDYKNPLRYTILCQKCHAGVHVAKNT